MVIHKGRKPRSLTVILGKRQYMTLKAAAHRLHVTTQTLRNWAKRGAIPSIRHPINRYMLFTEHDVQRLVRKMEGGQ